MPEQLPLSLQDVNSYSTKVLDSVNTVIVGKREPLKLVLAGILAGGHVLFEDYPGLGKTLTARCFAQTLGMHFNRLQFTPDLLPSDVTGSFLYNQKTGDFVFRQGPIFTNLLLADEINRTPPKTQAALLEAMQERQVSVEGTTYALAEPFCVLATANPIEHEGTYPLPEAQLDRFLLRVSFGYPNRDEELQVLQRRTARRKENTVLSPIVDAGTVVRMQQALENVAVEDSIGKYIVDIVAATREHSDIQVGASPRGSLALLLLGRAFAVLSGREYVLPEDIKAVAPAALAHRISLSPQLWLRNADPSAVIEKVCEKTPVPASQQMPTYAAGNSSWQPGAGA